MNKIFAVARAEYFIAVTSKAFIIGLLMMPIFMVERWRCSILSAIKSIFLNVVSPSLTSLTGCTTSIEKSAEQRNQIAIFSSEDEGEKKQIQPEFIVERAVANPESDQRLDVQLAERVKAGELFAYVIIENGVFEQNDDAVIRYHSQTPSYNTLPKLASAHGQQRRQNVSGFQVGADSTRRRVSGQSNSVTNVRTGYAKRRRRSR